MHGEYMEVERGNLQVNQYFSIEKVNTKGIGTTNIGIMNDTISINAISNDSYIRIPINELDFVLYSKGNFFIKSKIFLGICGDQFELSMRKNSQNFKKLYDTIVNLRKNINNKITSRPTNQDNEQNSIILSPSDEIGKYYNLFKQGAITKEEFEEKKKELLKK